MEIIKLFLEKLELLTEKERAILIDSIKLLNNPVYYSNNMGIGKINHL